RDCPPSVMRTLARPAADTARGVAAPAVGAAVTAAMAPARVVAPAVRGVSDRIRTRTSPRLAPARGATRPALASVGGGAAAAARTSRSPSLPASRALSQGPSWAALAGPTPTASSGLERRTHRAHAAALLEDRLERYPGGGVLSQPVRLAGPVVVAGAGDQQTQPGGDLPRPGAVRCRVVAVIRLQPGQPC